MCGIVAYSGDKDCTEVITDGLKKLEYRGYDSAGISFEEGGKLIRLRAVGKVSNLEELISKEAPHSKCGIGHTRWATHGNPSVKNCHPHCDCTGNIAIVHNGIIENYSELKETLLASGHTFSSDTDSEVIAHLIEENLKSSSDFETAFTLSIKQLKGAYSIACMYSGAPSVLMAAKRHSPLVLGFGDKEVFIASDVAAFLKHTNKVIFLEDGDIAKLTPESYSITNIATGPANRHITEISWDAATAEKDGYDHFMLKEIFDQPQAVEDTLLTLPPSFSKAFGIPAEQARKIQGFYLVACGTAYHAALTAKYFLESFTKLPVEVDTASEFKYRAVPFQKDWLFIAVTQSGETADTLAALRNAKNAGLKVMSICNVMGSSITRESDYTVYTHCGPEISVASTKAFTSQLAVLYSFALNLAYETGKINKEFFTEHYSELSQLPEFIRETLKLQDKIKELAQKYHKNNDFIFIGRNASFPIALEGALKLKEISYLHAEGFSAGEIKHGPIAIINKGIPVIALVPSDELYDKMLSNCQEVSARGADVIAIGNDPSCQGLCVSATGRYLFPILAIIPLQFFAYYISLLNGREIDRPRNLAKSVTVE